MVNRAMEFGEIRSRIHNGDFISWDEIELLSGRVDYMEEIVPYLSSFPEYWNQRVLYTIHTYRANPVEYLRACNTIAPFGWFRFIYESERERPEYYMREEFSRVKVLHIRRFLNGFWDSPYLSNVTHLDLHSPTPQEIEKITYSPNLSGVRQLQLWKPSYLEDFLKSPLVSRLTHLSLEGFSLGNREVDMLVSTCRNLTHLHLQGLPYKSTKDFVHMLIARLPLLEQLTLDFVHSYYLSREDFKACSTERCKVDMGYPPTILGTIFQRWS